MKCTNCGAQNAENSRFCSACGTSLPTVHFGTLILSPKEAKRGCQKDFFLPGMAAAMRFRLPPKTKNGQQLMVHNAGFLDGFGNVRCEPLQITVCIEKASKNRTRKKAKWWKPLIAICCFLAVFGAYLKLGSGLDRTGSSQAATTPDAKDLILNFDLKYFLNALDDKELDTVCLLYQSMMNFEEYCTVPDGVYEENIVSLIPLLEAECPELFQVDFSENIQYYYDQRTKEITKIKIPYRLEKDTYTDMLQECEAVINGFVTDTVGFTAAEKEKYVFDSIASSCWYDMEAEHAGTAYGALVAGSAKCDGISLAMKWCMETMGIQCLCVTADCPGETVGHAWNIINLDGDYYTLDLTMSVRNASYVDAGIEDIVYFQYNVSDAWAEERYVIHDFYHDIAQIPECTGNENSYYALSDSFVYAGQDPKEILFAAFDSAAKENQKVYFQFESEADYNAFLTDIDGMVQEWFQSQSKQFTSVRWIGLSFSVCMIELIK